ncbi:MAG: hypothetical protein ACJAS3_002123 [Roseivirga sp.]|jgi:hypothetical protein
MENWVIPLTLIPGIGMIILSTSHLSTSVSDEINTLLQKDNCDRSLIQIKISQLSLLNIALVSLYISTAIFSITGLIEGIFTLQNAMTNSAFRQTLLVTGVASLVIATFLLIAFSIRKVKIKRDQFLKNISN